jgi:hypothetical protein
MAAHFFQWPSSAQWHGALEAGGRAVPAGWIKPSLQIGRSRLELKTNRIESSFDLIRIRILRTSL